MHFALSQFVSLYLVSPQSPIMAPIGCKTLHLSHVHVHAHYLDDNSLPAPSSLPSTFSLSTSTPLAPIEPILQMVHDHFDARFDHFEPMMTCCLNELH